MLQISHSKAPQHFASELISKRTGLPLSAWQFQRTGAKLVFSSMVSRTRRALHFELVQMSAKLRRTALAEGTQFAR